MRGIKTGLMVAAGVSLVTVAGQAAATAPDLPPLYGVTVAWADSSHTQVRVTWQETVSVANRVQVWTGQQAGWSAVVTGPNEALVPALYIPKNKVARIAVSVGSTAGSPHVDSADFDTNTPAAPVITAAYGDYEVNTTELFWKAGTPPADTTPGDPLDLAQRRVLYQVGWRYPGEAGWSPATPLGPGMTAIAKPTLPEDKVYSLAVLTSANEWGPADAETIPNILHFQHAEAFASWSEPDTIFANVGVWTCGFPCDATIHVVPQEGSTVVLQHRANSAAPWSTTEVSHTAVDGITSFGPVPHSGEYRIVVPPRSYLDVIRHVNSGTTRIVQP